MSGHDGRRGFRGRWPGWYVALAAASLALAACGQDAAEPPNAVDAARLADVRADPALAGALAEPASVETGSSKRWNSRAKAMLSVMGDRRDPAGGVNDLNDRFRGWAFSRHEAGESPQEPAIEGLLRACHVSRLDHRARHLRPANRSAAFAAALLEHRFDVDRYAMGREA